jgi:glycosyltransferase involved in cell wall biosynthesis
VRALVVIPTYNEAESVVEVIDRVLAAEPRADVLVVDDGSPDGTAKLVLERSEGEPRVHLMERSGKQGMTRWWRWMLICRIRRSVCRRCWTGLPMPIW